MNKKVLRKMVAAYVVGLIQDNTVEYANPALSVDDNEAIRGELTKFYKNIKKVYHLDKSVS